MTPELAASILDDLLVQNSISAGPSAGQTAQQPPARDDIQAALKLARDAVLKMRPKGAGPYPNSGKSWSNEEESQLIAQFEQGVSTKLLASAHRRSVVAIHARLLKLGKIKEGDLIDGKTITKPRYDSLRQAQAVEAK